VQLREQVAVQKTMETELNKTIHITGMSGLQSVFVFKKMHANVFSKKIGLFFRLLTK
jgi:hypothetical protein